MSVEFELEGHKIKSEFDLEHWEEQVLYQTLIKHPIAHPIDENGDYLEDVTYDVYLSREESEAIHDPEFLGPRFLWEAKLYPHKPVHGYEATGEIKATRLSIEVIVDEPKDLIYTYFYQHG